METKEELLRHLSTPETPADIRELIKIEVLIDIRDVLQETLITLKTSAGREAFRIGQASLQEIGR